MKEVAISVIVPVYGVERYIERCVRSLFGQTMTEGVEFIFINDCTKDRSIELLTSIIGEYPQVRSRVKIINHLRNRGLAAARQTGLTAAQGEYILHLDSDDYFESDMLEVMYGVALDKEADVVVSDFFMSFKDGDVYQECPLYDSKESMFKSIIAPWRYGNKTVGSSVWNKLIKRSICMEHNINSIEGINYGEDFIVISQILYYAVGITKVDRAFVHYNQQNIRSYTHNKSASNMRQRLKSTNVIADFLSVDSTVYNDVFDERRSYELLIAISNCNLKDQRHFLQLYPWLDYEKHRHLVPRLWRLPYMMALRGHVRLFNCIRLGIKAGGYIYKTLNSIIQ